MEYNNDYTSIFNLRQELKSLGADINNSTALGEFDDLVKSISNPVKLSDMDWTKSIFDSAPAKIGLSPRVVYVLSTSYDKLDITTYANWGGHTIYTSDGQTYTIEDGGDPITHTWDTSKDLTSPDGYKCRYIISYEASDSTDSYTLYGWHVPVLNMYVGGGRIDVFTVASEGFAPGMTTLRTLELGNVHFNLTDADDNIRDNLMLQGCMGLQCVKLNGKLRQLSYGALSGCKADNFDIGHPADFVVYGDAFDSVLINQLIIPHGCTSIEANAFKNALIKSLSLPNTLTNLDSTAFFMIGARSYIQEIILEEDFDCSLNLVGCELLTREALVNITRNLKQYTGDPQRWCILPPQYEDEIGALVTAKGWSLTEIVVEQ